MKCKYIMSWCSGVSAFGGNSNLCVTSKSMANVNFKYINYVPAQHHYFY